MLDVPVQLVQDDTRLNARNSALRIDVENAVQIFRHVDDDTKIAALPRQTGAAAARQNRSAEVAGGLDGFEDIVDRTRDDDADRDVAVIGRVRRIESARSVIESNLASDSLS